MKKLVLMGMALVLLSFFGLAQAQVEKARGASQKAQERASDQAIFNRVSDWFATVGRPQEEKERILQERQARRAEREAEIAAKKAQAEARKAEGEKRALQERESQRAGQEAEKGARKMQAEPQKEEGLRMRTEQQPGRGK